MTDQDQNEQNRQPGQQIQQGQQGLERQQNQGQGADNTNRAADDEERDAEAGLDNEFGDAGEEEQD